MIPALILAALVSLAPVSPAEAEFLRAKAVYNADIAVLSTVYGAWQADRTATAPVEQAISAALADWSSVDVADCFSEFWALRYASLLGLVDLFKATEHGLTPTGIGASAGDYATLADAAEVSVTCSADPGAS